MGNYHRETSSASWFGRIVESIKGVLVGLLLILVAVVLLFWNEGRAVRTAKSLEEGASKVVTVKADAVDAGNDGKLVAVTGEVTAKEDPIDPQFGATAPGIVLRRTVDMFQWIEERKSTTKKKLGGGEETTTEYTYKTDWSAGRVDSGTFKVKEDHENPPLPYESKRFVAKGATLGAFEMPDRLVSGIDAATPLAVESRALKSAEPAVASAAIVSDGLVYVGRDPAHPALGDCRVKFEIVKATLVSIVAMQSGSTFEPFPTKAGDPIEMLKVGAHSADSMFQAAQATNVTMTWMLRAFGWILAVLGFYLVFRPLEVVADVVPILGSLLGAGLFLFALLIGTFLSAVDVAIAWIFYRPILGGALLGGAVACVVVLLVVARVRRGRR